MIKIFDTHAHYDDEDFNEDRNELIETFKDKGVLKVCNIGASLSSSRETLELTRKYDFFYGAVGVHPSEVRELEAVDGMAMLEAMVNESEKIVAIGEIGLDYHYEDTDKPLQKKWFIEQLELARHLKLPVIIHSRDAAKDTIDIMREQKASDIGGVVHCYSYEVEMAKLYEKMGFYFGIGGVLTFKNSRKLKEVVDYLPLEKIVLETDAPYLAPVPFRGKRNNSTYIEYVAKEIADIKGIDVDEVYETTFNNALKLYNISSRKETT